MTNTDDEDKMLEDSRTLAYYKIEEGESVYVDECATAIGNLSATSACELKPAKMEEEEKSQDKK